MVGDRDLDRGVVREGDHPEEVGRATRRGQRAHRLLLLLAAVAEAAREVDHGHHRSFLRQCGHPHAGQRKHQQRDQEHTQDE